MDLTASRHNNNPFLQFFEPFSPKQGHRTWFLRNKAPQSETKASRPIGGVVRKRGPRKALVETGLRHQHYQKDYIPEFIFIFHGYEDDVSTLGIEYSEEAEEPDDDPLDVCLQSRREIAYIHGEEGNESMVSPTRSRGATQTECCPHYHQGRFLYEF